MMAPKVWQQLRALTPVEAAQQRNAQVADDLPPAALDVASSESAGMPVLNNYFFRHRNLYISKHNRFAAYPQHAHEFLELNYMLSGQAHQRVNGQSVTLREGDLLLIDVGSRHAIAALGQDDLLINVLIHDPRLSLAHLDRLQSQASVLAEFQHERLQRSPVPGHLIFPAAGNAALQATLQRLIEEYVQHQPFSETILEAETTVLIAQLTRALTAPQVQLTQSQRVVMAVLTAIHTDYAQVSLERLADELAYNRNYLGNLFRREVGKTFSQALTEERLLQARALVRTTRQPIRRIIAAVGLTNTSFFYTKYAERFGCTPSEDRRAGIPHL